MTVASGRADVAFARPRARTAALTALALLAFAANSILTRLALGRHLIDAATFTEVRLGAGAAVLGGLTLVRSKGWAPLRGRGWRGPLALFAYAAPFSLAYGRIGAAVGALILFGSVQLTMIGWGLAHGERPTPRTWMGLGLGATGLGWLMLPAASRPDALGSCSVGGRRPTDWPPTRTASWAPRWWPWRSSPPRRRRTALTPHPAVWPWRSSRER